MTASVAGLFGNFGQANYSAAKLGLVGLSNTLAIEGGKYGIHSNVIVPMAASRLTKDILPPDMFESLAPEHIAPVVAWMCHEDCEDNGIIVEALAGWAGRYRWQRSQGAALLGPNGKVTPECVREKWHQIVGMEGADFPTSHQEATMDVMSRIQENVQQDEADEEKTIKDAIGFVSEPFDFNYSFKEAIIYNLSVGASTKDADSLKFLYEGHDNFSPLPTFGVIPALSGLDGVVTGGVPGLSIDLSRVLHGEQFIKLLKPLSASAKLTSRFKIQDILDKGKGMVVLVEVESRDEDGDVVLLNQLSIFVVGGGGFGGSRTSKQIIDVIEAPSRTPDATSEYQTSYDQAALYRMTGDLNPLHISPDFAAMGGFKTPILHGLCSFGISVRQIMEKFAENDPARVTAMKVRMSKPVLPGQKLRTDMWLQGDKVLFETTVVETGAKCLTGGWVQISLPNSKL